MSIFRFVLESSPDFVRCDSLFTFFDFEFRKELRSFVKYPSNGMLWKIWLLGLERSNFTGFSGTKSFLRGRAAAELDLFEKAKVSKNKVAVCVDVYTKVTMVDASLIKMAMDELVSNIDVSPRRITKNTAEFAIRHHLDFYFWFIAYADRDITEYYLAHAINEDQAEAELGVFQNILPSKKGGKYITPINSLFNRWRSSVALKVLGKERPFNWSQLSQFLPDPIFSNTKKSDVCEEKIKKNKYRELASWRSGKVIPSDEKLQGFIDNLLPLCRQRQWFFWYAKAAIGMNQLFFEIEKSKVFSEDELINIFQDFNRYHSAAKSMSNQFQDN